MPSYWYKLLTPSHFTRRNNRAELTCRTKYHQAISAFGTCTCRLRFRAWNRIERSAMCPTYLLDMYYLADYITDLYLQLSIRITWGQYQYRLEQYFTYFINIRPITVHNYLCIQIVLVTLIFVCANSTKTTLTLTISVVDYSFWDEHPWI